MIISIENLSVCYGCRTLFSDVNLRASEGCSIALLGRNGSGKSTFLRCLLGLMKPTAGNVLADGQDVHSMSPSYRSRIFSYVSTTSVQVAYLTARDVVSMGRTGIHGWTGALSKEDNKIVDQSLDAVDILELESRYISSLSDGERQRVMIARALAQQTPVMILDEPTAFLDVPNRISISSLLKRLAKQSNKIVIYSTHEVGLAHRYADCFWLLDNESISQLPADKSLLPSDFTYESDLCLTE